MKCWVMEADLGEQPGEGREQWLEMACLASGWHSGLPELLSVSTLGDGVGWQLHQPPWPLGSPATHRLLHQSLMRDCPLLWEGVLVFPPATSTLVAFGSFCLLKVTHTFPCLCLVPQPPHLVLPDLLAGQDQTPFSCLIHTVLLTLLYMNVFPQSHKTCSFPQKTEFLRGFLLSETFEQVRAGGTLSLRGASFIPEKAGAKCKRFLKNRRYFHHHQLSLPHVVQHSFQIRLLLMCLCSLHSSWGEWRSADVY